MRIHSIEKIKKLKRLRRKGHSINELVAELSIPKTTVWHHIQGVKVLPRYVQILKSKRGGSRKRKEIGWKKARTRARELLQGPYRELVIVITMLYWGEGTKDRFAFINSDGKMIQLYLLILRKVFNVPETDIKPILRIYSGMDRSKCLDYWSKITKISLDKFTVRLNDGGTKGRTKYGMCRIIIRKGGSLFKLMKSLIDISFEELITKD